MLQENKDAIVIADDVCRSIRSIEINSRYMFSHGGQIREFKDISKAISSLLPDISDSSLCEIDDLIYPDYTYTNIPSTPLPKESIKSFIDEICPTYLMEYFKTFRKLLCKSFKCDWSVVDMAVLKIIENASDALLLDIQNKYYNKKWQLIDAIKSRNEFDVCRSVKMIKTIHKRNKKIYENNNDYVYSERSWFYINLDNLIWMSNLRNIPEAKDPDKKRITNWLRKQALEMHEFSPMDIFETYSSIYCADNKFEDIFTLERKIFSLDYEISYDKWPRSTSEMPMKTILSKCPFLILPSNKCHLANDLIRLWKGEDVDRATIELLYFSINTGIMRLPAFFNGVILENL